MDLWRLVCLALIVRSVHAGSGWDDFANNLATDLAPLITLFGDRLTKQFLSESINVLDNFIFALAPLGILTAVVSVIRVCGNSSLRAFIGRAQEGPGEAENELLSCVSETTAELFNAGGISRVFGRPRILEIVAWEDDQEKSLVIGTLRDALRGKSKSWYSKSGNADIEDEHDPVLDIPNLSLNRGIKRRSQVSFYTAAVLGVLSQSAVTLYAMVTVFIYPSAFHKDGKPVAQYAFPLATVGTVLLSFGMFHCAFIIERSSKEYYLYPSKPSKIYWLQTGQQKVGDQHFGAFMAVNEGPDAQPTMNLSYIKSTKHLKYYERKKQLLFATGLTMLGFVTQFVGLRGLHSSVIMGQMAATLFMSVVRTSLRTKRIDLRENQLSKEDQKLTPHNQQELDCFAFHLEGIDKFELLSSTGNELSDSQYSFSSAPALVSQSSDPTPARINVIHTRARLVELTSGSENSSTPGWDDLPMRKIAQNLARTIEMTMDLLSSWECRSERAFDFKLGYRYKPVTPKSAAYVSGCHTIRLERSEDTLRWRIDDKQLEAILGLWTWSMLRSNEGWPQTGFCRLVGLDQTEAGTEEADLYFHKWIYRQTEARMVSSGVVGDSNRLFGVDSSEGALDKEILVVKTQNELGVMAAQDMYIRFLMSVVDGVDDLGGTADLVPGSQNTFLAQSSRLDELVGCFEACSLGSREDALLCIVPVLRRCNLLPELAADSSSIRNRSEGLLRNDRWKEAFNATRWLCERSNSEEFKQSVIELGYLCRKAMLHGDPNVRQIGVDQVCNLLRADIRASYFQTVIHPRGTTWMRSSEARQWWEMFSKQLGWLACHICNRRPDMQEAKAALEASGATGDLPSASQATDSQMVTTGDMEIVLLWLALPDDFKLPYDPSESEHYKCFLWTVHNGYDSISSWMLIRWAEVGQHLPMLLHAAFGWAAASGSASGIQTLCRHGGHINGTSETPASPLLGAVANGDAFAARRLLENGADVNIGRSADRFSPLIAASQEGQSEIIRLLLSYGADIDMLDFSGNTALSNAVRNGHDDSVRLLLSEGGDVQTISNEGWTPLLHAVSNNRLSTVRILLDHGADINSVTLRSSTVLIIAAQQNLAKVIQLLLDCGADVHATDEMNLTALDWAKEYDHTDAVILLESAE